MKSISHMVVVAALACAGQAAWSDETSPAKEQSAESLNVAQIVAPEGHPAAASEVSSARKSRNILEELGLAGDGPFPSRGGPIDE